MFHDESWKPINFEVKRFRSHHRSQKHCRRGSL